MTPLEAEIAVAVIGLDRIMAGSPSWSLEKQADAEAFPKRARALLLKALGRTAPEADDDAPAFDYDEAKRLLEADDDAIERRADALFATLPDDVQDDVLAAASKAIEHLQGILPRRVTKTTARVDVSPPEPFELDRFARAWRVAVDPMSALRAMAEGGLDMVSVEALAAAYPEIYKLVSGRAAPGEEGGGGLLDDVIATMKGRRGDRWDISDDQDRQVKILLGEEPIDLDLANEFAAMTPITPAQQPRQRSKPTAPIDELLPGQKQG